MCNDDLFNFFASGFTHLSNNGAFLFIFIFFIIIFDLFCFESNEPNESKEAIRFDSYTRTFRFFFFFLQ